MKTDKEQREVRPGISDRSRARQARMSAQRSHSFKEAEDWDLDFWQSVGPEERLSALVALRDDLLKVEKSRGQKHEYSS